MNKRTPINKLWAEKPAAATSSTPPGSQDSLLSSHPDVAASDNQAGKEATTSATDKRKGQTLRLTRDAWKQLKLLAIERDRTAHDLLIEAVNDLFRKHGKPPIA